MGQWDAWIGREQRATDMLDEALAARWLATFDLPNPDPAIMPQGIHFALCTPDAPTAALGEDGHPARNDSADSFLPPFQMPRRMWASSDIQFDKPIEVGSLIERRSRVVSVREKEGRTGPLAFVELEHITRANGAIAVTETQTLVYREAAVPDAPLAPPEPGSAVFDASDCDAIWTVTPDPRLLFRYSALTFNTHRIHYDAPYAREVERYRGLVVHGPLTASLLLQLAARELGENAVDSFEFRGVSPAVAGEELTLVMHHPDEGTGEFGMGAFAADGRQVMKVRARAFR